MNRKLSSLIDELSDYVPTRDGDLFVESRARQVIGSAINLINLIESRYGVEEADDLKRRLMNSIKSKDEAKFCRKIKQIREGKNVTD